ncbi:MAG: hypothetical protein A2297_05790 [Elusimicrobia bacterium RIFOXYB2_FULL_48_7]|nr:MAG: hypothetical protein A2297_05790 [Elusimicrobia bacterium RIFOXYB2_FULL_48_7]
MTKKFTLAAAVASLAVFASAGHYSTARAANESIETSIETKISIETSLEERLRKVLTEIAGTDKIIIIINTELYSEKEKKELQIKPVSQRAQTVLPGVPVKENIGERKIEDLIAPLDIGQTKTMIKKISATVILDKAVSQDIVEIIKKVATGLLGVDAERGDQLVIERMNFKRNPFSWNSLIYPPQVFYVIAIALFTFAIFSSILFLFNPFKIFSKSLVDVIASYVAVQKESGANEAFGGGTQSAGAAAAETAAATQAAAAIPADAEQRRPFWFISPVQGAQLADALKTEQPENIAVVLNYLPREMASRICAGFPADQRVKIAELFTGVRQMDPDAVKSLEQKVKDSINYSLGGQDVLLGLLDYSDKATQEKVIASIKVKNPEAAAKLQKSVFSFEDIALFDANAIQVVMRRLNLAAFAQVLKSTPEGFRAKILQGLTEAARKRMQQEIELGRPLSAVRIEEEKRKIIDAVRQLNTEGLIELKK